MVTEKLLFSSFKTIADKFPDCDAKELQQFKENAENSSAKKSTKDSSFCLHGLQKKKKKGNSPGILSFEASQVFRLGKKEG